jgi:hypothetical protein
LSQSYSKWTVNYNKSLTFNCSGIKIEIEISLLTKSGPQEDIKAFEYFEKVFKVVSKFESIRLK